MIRSNIILDKEQKNFEDDILIQNFFRRQIVDSLISNNDDEYYYQAMLKVNASIKQFEVKRSKVIIHKQTYIIWNISDISKTHEQKDALQKELEQKQMINVAQNAFLSKMSHDIRTPMNAIIGMISIAIQNIDNQEHTLICLNKAVKSSEYLLKLINNILEYSKIEDGNYSLYNRSFEINAFNKTLIASLKEELDSKQIELICRCRVKDMYVYSDKVCLMKILTNIISNSIKYSDSHHLIKYDIYKIAQDNNKVVLQFAISDSGEGMHKDVLTDIFKPFNQVNTKLNHKEGTGLGLAICKRYIDLLNGTIEVVSELDVGTKFVVTIPFPLGSSEADKEAEIFTDFENKRVLLVDDNELNAEIASEILTQKKMQVEIAENGQVAINRIMLNIKNYYDVILMDLQMPTMDGITATKQIRAIERDDCKTIPIVAMTANTFDDDKNKAFEAGMNGFISKPIDINLLFETLRSVLK